MVNIWIMKWSVMYVHTRGGGPKSDRNSAVVGEASVVGAFPPLGVCWVTWSKVCSQRGCLIRLCSAANTFLVKLLLLVSRFLWWQLWVNKMPLLNFFTRWKCSGNCFKSENCWQGRRFRQNSSLRVVFSF